jgi:hypothetical protein
MGVLSPSPIWRYCPAPDRLIEVDNMGANLGNNSPRDSKSLHKKLADLYSRRIAVESLIRCLESYAECQAKNGERRQLRSA